MLYIQDEGGDENWHLYATDVIAETTKDLLLIKVSRRRSRHSREKARFGGRGLNDRVPEYHDLWEVNLATGKRVLIEQNSQEFAGYDLDPRSQAEARAEESGRRRRNLPQGRRQSG